MRVLGISGSPRREGNTEILVNVALKALAKEGMETDFLSLAETPIEQRIAGDASAKSAAAEGSRDDPVLKEIIDRFRQADGILVASPVYFSSATPQTMALLNHVGYLSRRTDKFLRRKVGAAIAVGRRAGQNFTIAQLNYWFLLSEMIIPGSTYWNIGFGLKKGDVNDDEEGIKTIRDLAANMAWVMKKLNA